MTCLIFRLEWMGKKPILGQMEWNGVQMNGQVNMHQVHMHGGTFGRSGSEVSERLFVTSETETRLQVHLKLACLKGRGGPVSIELKE
ncbi:hypothetical protein AVEN_148167-1 [Araneus ventricosus]|uniref:Uncharacterized protein n=1 Tax=Araneus ventricosus TaxID=182803 RepID=A0A4Y2TEU9_ARAVE|nr:hypothetical protein AVEN_148167-1 [Araneus ventricosus]